MVSLLDIADVQRTIPLRGVDVEVQGISAEGIAVLINRFPEIRSLLAGRGLNLSVDDVLSLAPKVIAAIIASGCGKPGVKEFEEKALTLTLGEQSEFVLAILDATFPQGLKSFVKKLEALGFNLPGRDGDLSAPASPQANGGAYGKAPDTKSLEQSRSL